MNVRNVILFPVASIVWNNKIMRSWFDEGGCHPDVAFRVGINIEYIYQVGSAIL